MAALRLSPPPPPKQRLPAGLKLAAAVAFVTVTALLPREPHLAYLALAILLLATWPFTGMPLRYALTRLLLAQLLIAGIAGLWLFNPASAPIVFAAFIKSNLSILAMLMLAWTTPFSDLLRVLKRIGLPPVMITTLALMYRYLPVLADESRRMQRARASRTFLRSHRFAWHNLSLIISQLFLRSVDRAERIYLAMCARGWK